MYMGSFWCVHHGSLSRNIVLVVEDEEKKVGSRECRRERILKSKGGFNPRLGKPCKIPLSIGVWRSPQDNCDPFPKNHARWNFQASLAMSGLLGLPPRRRALILLIFDRCFRLESRWPEPCSWGPVVLCWSHPRRLHHRCLRNQMSWCETSYHSRSRRRNHSAGESEPRSGEGRGLVR